MAWSGLKIMLLLLALRITDAGRHNYCGNVFPVVEMEAEMRQYSSFSQQLSTIFEEESHLVKHIISYITSDKQPLIQLYERLPSQIRLFNNFFINWVLVLIFCVASGFVTKYVAQRCGYDIEKFSLISAKTVKMVIIIVCFLVLVQACAGMSGGVKQRKSLNEILCRLFKEPRGMLRNSQQSQDFQAFHKYLQTIDQQTIKNLKLYRPVIDNLLQSSQAVRISKIVLPELAKNQGHSAFVAEFASSFSDLQAMGSKIKASQIKYWHKQNYQAQLYSHNLIIADKVIIKGIENYGSCNNFGKIIDIYSFIVVGFYGMIMLASAALLVLTIRNRDKVELLKDSLLPWVQYFLIIVILICISTYLFTSILVPHLYWVRNGIHYTMDSSSHLYQQMSLLTERNSEITEVTSFIAPLNKTFSQVYERRFQKMAEEVNRIISPYIANNATYFYDQLKQSLAYIQDEEFRAKVGEMIEQKEVKQPFIDYFNETLAAHKQILDSFQIYSIINGGNFGKIIIQFVEISCSLLINRSVENHETCEQLIALLSIIAFLLFISGWREDQIEEKELSSEEISDASETSVNSDMNLS